jgi:hypothetical protein
LLNELGLETNKKMPKILETPKIIFFSFVQTHATIGAKLNFDIYVTKKSFPHKLFVKA